MQKTKNPYTPGAGRTPRFLAGREKVLNDVSDILDDLSSGSCVRSIIFYGLRGVGKTVLLNAIETMCEERSDIVCRFFEVSESGDFKSKITSAMQKILINLSHQEKIRKSFEQAIAILKAFKAKWNPAEQEFEFGFSGDFEPAKGVADTGNFADDILELMLSIGKAAAEQDMSICLLIDEMQYFKKDELEAIAAALHRCNQKDIPFCIFGAGLPKIAKDAGDAKSYAERLFLFQEVDSLELNKAKAALVEPAKDFNVTYDKNAIDYVMDLTEGYPYFIQEYGLQIWKHSDIKETYCVTLIDVKATEPLFWRSLDESFFKVRFDRATPTEQAFMFAMARCDSTPCNMAAVASFMGKNVKSISPVRAQLIAKGLIYATRYGQVDYTVPQFSKYLRRFHTDYFA